MDRKKIGVIIQVDGDLSTVGMYNNANDSSFIFNGNILIGPKIGSFLTINQNNIKIISTVVSEKVLDEKNTINTNIFDNTFSENSIKRIIVLKTKGILENNRFVITNKNVPMIGNLVTITTNEELSQIYGIDDAETIEIGRSMLEDYPIKLSINDIFASHIGIFGNTGSGKSNTLHKLYLELFKTNYYSKIKYKSKFYVIDFNGEYCTDNIFGIKKEDLKIINVDTKKQDGSDKIYIKENYFFDADVLSVLFDARPATQVPFIKNTLKKYINIIKSGKEFADIEIGLFKTLLINCKKIVNNNYEEWIDLVHDICTNKNDIELLKNLCYSYKYGDFKVYDPVSNINIVVDNHFTEDGMRILKIQSISEDLCDSFNKMTPFKKLNVFFKFQKIYETAWQGTNPKFLDPLIKRIDISISSLEKVLVLDKNIDDKYNMFNVISLLNANLDVKRLVPMLFSKMIYSMHKEIIDNEVVSKTIHLIIDEAHNILNESSRNIGDEWQDYRLSIFEEIIKEGRKFGFYLTLASQRPADISPTIMSQLHNYFIHRLVNDNDINMLRNTMSTLDSNSFYRIPLLGQGETIITGSSLNVPLLVKVYKEEKVRPKSDDINLINLWNS